MTRRDDLVVAAEVALGLLRADQLLDRWDEPSALAEMTNGALAHHLGSQVVSAHAGLTDPDWAPRGEVVTLVEHYRRSAWVGADLDHASNVGIREGSTAGAAEGPGVLLSRVEAALDGIRSVDHVPEAVRMPHWEWCMAGADFLLTRMMELMVHTDDLAVGLAVATPVFPASVAGPVLALLTSIAEDQHGQAAVVRALTRSERATSIVVF